MFFRLFLLLIKPSNNSLKKKAPGAFLKMRMWLYKFILKRMLKTYVHYAISDSISISNGKIRILHEYRDLDFEKELARNRIVFTSDAISTELPATIKKGKSKWKLKYFKFKDSLHVSVNGKNLAISHDELYSLYGSAKGKARCTNTKGTLSQSAIELLATGADLAAEKAKVQRRTDETVASHIEKAERPKPKPAARAGRNLFEREKERISTAKFEAEQPESTRIHTPTAPNVRRSEPPRADETRIQRSDNAQFKTEEREEPKPAPIKKKGFEIDSSF